MYTNIPKQKRAVNLLLAMTIKWLGLLWIRNARGTALYRASCCFSYSEDK